MSVRSYFSAHPLALLGVCAALFGVLVGLHIQPQIDDFSKGAVITLLITTWMLCAILVICFADASTKDEVQFLARMEQPFLVAVIAHGIGLGAVTHWVLGVGVIAACLIAYATFAFLDRELHYSRYAWVHNIRDIVSEVTATLILMFIAVIIVDLLFRAIGIDARLWIALFTACCITVGVLGIAVFAAHAVQPWDNPIVVSCKAVMLGTLVGACCIAFFVSQTAFFPGFFFGAGLTLLYHVIMWGKCFKEIMG